MMMFQNRYRLHQLMVWLTVLVVPSTSFVLLHQRGKLKDIPHVASKQTRMEDSMSLLGSPRGYYTIDGGEEEDGPGSWYSPHQPFHRHIDPRQYQNGLRAPNKPASAYMEVMDGDDDDYNGVLGAFGGDIIDDEEDEETFLSFPSWVTDKAASSSVGFSEHESSVSSSSSSGSFGGVPGPPPVGMFLKEKQAQRLDGTVLDIFKDWKPPEEQDQEAVPPETSTPIAEDASPSEKFEQDEAAWDNTYEEIHANVQQDTTTTTSETPAPPSSFVEQESFGIWENALKLPTQQPASIKEEEEEEKSDTVVMMQQPVSLHAKAPENLTP